MWYVWGMSRAEHLETLRQAVVRYGQPESMTTFLSHIMRAESDGNLRARNPYSGATGLFQFIQTTWDQYGRGSIYDPAAQCDAVVRFTMDNAKVLRPILGREPNAGEYYLAHFAGATGASKILTASPTASVRSILGDQVIQQNAPINFRGKRFADFTAGDLREWSASLMGVDMPAREQYAMRRRQGITTREEDDSEWRIRLHNLEAFGVKKELLDMLKPLEILGDIILAMLKYLVDMASPALSRDGQQVMMQSVQRVQAATVGNVPARS